MTQSEGFPAERAVAPANRLAIVVAVLSWWAGRILFRLCRILRENRDDAAVALIARKARRRSAAIIPQPFFSELTEKTFVFFFSVSSTY